MNWTLIYGAALHLCAVIGILVLVGTGSVPWSEVSNAFYGLVGLGIGVAVVVPSDAKPPAAQ